MICLFGYLYRIPLIPRRPRSAEHNKDGQSGGKDKREKKSKKDKQEDKVDSPSLHLDPDEKVNISILPSYIALILIVWHVFYH